MTATNRPSHGKPAHGAGAHAHDDHLYDELHNEDVAHEHSDVNVRALIFSAVGLAAVVGLCAVVVLGLFYLFESQAAARDIAPSPLARPANQEPPEPRLLKNEPENLQLFRAAQTEALKGIDDAKKRLLEQGLPVRADAPADAWMGTHAPARGESSAGRRIPLNPGDVPPAQPIGTAPAAAPKPAAPPKSGGH